MRIGLLPAAGRATRLQCAQSKECLPVSKDRYAADALLSLGIDDLKPFLCCES